MTLHTQFDYSSLEDSSRIYIRQQTEEIRKRLSRMAHQIWEIGERLAKVRSRLQHGQFTAWLRVEFGWSQRTAYNFINVFQAFPDLPQRLQDSDLEIAATALYLLAAPSTPQQIRDDFLNRAMSGQKVSFSEVKALLQTVKQSLKKEALPGCKSSILFPSRPTIQETEPQRLDVVIQPNTVERQLSFQPTKPSAGIISIIPSWNAIAGGHHIFYGDTASPQFYRRTPTAALLLAVTSDDWDHDWVISKAKTVMVLPQSEFDLTLLAELIVRFSKEKEVVVLPWLPEAQMLRTAHELKRIVYGGDTRLCCCQRAIAGLMATC